MSFLQSLILSIVQGITEFLPVSSSAHLVLVPYMFNWKIPEAQIFPFDVLVQLGTLVAVILYFRNDLWSIIKSFFSAIRQRQPFATTEARLGWYLILATIPAGLAGVIFKDSVEAAFNDPQLTAYFLYGTAILLVAAEIFGQRSRQLETIRWVDALWIGIFQAFAIFPGISRSGATLTGGMTRNLYRPAAARFSFLMSIPIMLAAGVFSLSELFEVPNLKAFLPVLSVGFVTAGVVGYLAIRWLLAFLSHRSLYYFAVYCILLGTAVLITFGIRTSHGQSQTTDESNNTAAVETVNVDVNSALDWLRPEMSACANNIKGIAIITSSSDLGSADQQALALRWGAPKTLDQPAFTLGEDELAIVVNMQNTLSSLPLEVMQQIASGKITDWETLHTICAECFSAPLAEPLLSAPIEFVVFPAGDDSRTLFEKSVMEGAPLLDSMALLVPSPTAMNENIIASQNSLGFMPARAVSAAIKSIALTDLTPGFPTVHPILAISQSEPAGVTAQWLSCLQASINP